MASIADLSRDARPEDTLRQGAFLAVIVTFVGSNWLPRVIDGGRTIGEQSDANPGLLVPWGPAFSIWFVIFLGIAAFGVMQALPRNRARRAFRASGWWIVGALGLSSLWSVLASFAPLGITPYVTAPVLTAYTVVAVQAMIALDRLSHTLSPWELRLALWPSALLAGWTSIAAFLNWEQVLRAQSGSSATGSIVLLGGALAWVALNLWRTGGLWSYAAAPLWGLVFLVYGRTVAGPISYPVAGAAVLGIGVIFFLTIALRQRRA